MRVADLHCDLLSYLAQKEGRSLSNNECRCSLSQLRKGNVALQTLAVFVNTKKGSTENAARQLEIFLTLPTFWPHDFSFMQSHQIIERDKIEVVLAIENASCFCEEDEALDRAFERFENFKKRAGQILYISLTWNHENRFAGGAHSKKGLKRDGELFLEYLSGRKVAIDLSHASDSTAADILNTIDKKGLDISVIASHSNFRAIVDQVRNLPDFLAKEIISRKGVIGLNFVKNFIGHDFEEDIVRHIEYCRSLDGMEHLCLGADFFFDRDFSYSLSMLVSFFHEFFDHSGCYPLVFEHLGSYFSKNELEKIAYKNFEQYLERQVYDLIR